MITQAYVDLRAEDPAVRQRAMAFFEESARLHVWCHMLNIDPAQGLLALGGEIASQ
jgi:hypothetical protein